MNELSIFLEPPLLFRLGDVRPIGATEELVLLAKLCMDRLSLRKALMGMLHGNFCSQHLLVILSISPMDFLLTPRILYSLELPTWGHLGTTMRYLTQIPDLVIPPI